MGLLCAALGKPRLEATGNGLPTLSELAALRMGVRVDQPGSFLMDYHTASDVRKADGGMKDTVLSYRHYLADACFLVGLEGDRPLLTRLDEALRRPVWQLALGRKSCVPSMPVRLPDEKPQGPGLTDLPLEQALQSIPLICRQGRADSRIQLVIEQTGLSGETRLDVPLGFAARRFGSRVVQSIYFDSKEFPLCISPDLLSIDGLQQSAAI